jgi:UDP-glucuronate decarboxylase
LGNPKEFTVAELADLVLELSETRVPLVFRPLPADDPRQRRPDISRATELLGFLPTVQLREGLTRTLADFRERLANLNSTPA